MLQIVLFLLMSFIRPEAAPRPNILFIVSEDNGPEMGCYGTPIQTPNLDKLASEGVLFERAYVPQAGCSQSRAAFLTGLYPHQNGQIGLATWKYQMFQDETPNVTTSLKKAGYRTGIIGKLHVNPESAFDFDWLPAYPALRTANFKRNHLDKYATEADLFINASDDPFYLQVNYPDAHEPFLTQVDGIPAVPLTAKDVEALPYMGVTDEQLRQKTADYYNCMLRLDHYIGELLEVLKRSGKYENTLIVYIGDHGADLLRGKRTSYEGGVRIPLIISDGRLHSKASKTKSMVSTLDLYPTFLAAAGIDVPAYLPGFSLMPLVNGGKVKDRKYLFTEYHVHSNHNPYPQRTVRDNRYKLIHNLVPSYDNPGYEYTLDHVIKYSKSELQASASPRIFKAYEQMKHPPEFELYDLKKDPFEFENLVASGKHQKVLEKMKKVLHQWQLDTNDPMIDPMVAKQVFDAILETGIEGKEKKLVPYLEVMAPPKILWK